MGHELRNETQEASAKSDRGAAASRHQVMARGQRLRLLGGCIVKRKDKKPTHKRCRNCGEWFQLPPYARPTHRFCTVSCARQHQNAQPKWKKAHSKRMK